MYRDKSRYSDIKLICNDGELYYSKFMLERIPFFKSMFNGGFAEADIDEITLDSNCNCIELLLNCVEIGENNIRNKLIKLITSHDDNISELYLMALYLNYEPIVDDIESFHGMFYDKLLDIAINHCRINLLTTYIKTMSNVNTPADIIERMYFTIYYFDPKLIEAFRRTHISMISKTVLNHILDNNITDLEPIVIRIVEAKINNKINDIEFFQGVSVKIFNRHEWRINDIMKWINLNPETKFDVIEILPDIMSKDNWMGQFLRFARDDPHVAEMMFKFARESANKDIKSNNDCKN